MKYLGLSIPIIAIIVGIFGAIEINKFACSTPGAIDGSTFRDLSGQCRLKEPQCAERLVVWVTNVGDYLIIPKFRCRQ